MGQQLDRVMRSIDSGLQSSLEHGYGTDRAPELCARCQHNPPAPTSKDLCGECRAWLLGDVDVDPVESAMSERPTFIRSFVVDEMYEFSQALERLSVVLTADVEVAAAALRSVANASQRGASAILEFTTAYETRRYELESWTLDSDGRVYFDGSCA